MNKPKILTQAMKLLIVLVIIILTIPVITALTSEEAAEAPLIRLQYASFDPLQGEPNAPVEGNYQAAADSLATYLLQFSGPVQQDWKAAVQAAGVRLYGYVPDYAFIARMDGATAQQVVELPYVRWVGVYYPAYRLSNSLLASQTAAQPEAVEVTVETLPDADLQSLATQIQALGGSVQGQAQNSLAGYLRVSMPEEDQVGALAALDGVLWVEPYFEPELINDQGGGVIMHGAGVRSALGLSGSGQVVGVADSGLDTGNQSTLHPDVSGRVVNAYCLGRPSPCDWSDYVSHGTHVVGSVLGDGTASGGAYAGVAPEAGLVFQSLGDATGGLGGVPGDRGDLMRQAYGDGARIHTNSWGGASGGALNPYGGYVSSSQQVDTAMWENKDLLVLFAAGNHGADPDKDGLIDPDSIGQPGTAKNVLTVGASENDRPGIPNLWGSSYGAPIDTDLRADKPYGMAAFSSRGPTDDGRVKPDIVAPGTFIASMRTRQYVFNDNGSGSGYDPNAFTVSGGTGSSAWQLRTDDPHSASHYWRETINGSFSAGAMTILLTPPMDVRPAGRFFEVHLWHKYNLSAGDRLAVLVINPDTSAYFGTLLGESGSSGVYSLRSVTGFDLYDFSTIPSTIQIGFAIQSGGSSNSNWQVDDIRVDGSDWGTMNSVGLANPGDTIDEAYQMMGGTSMATPLTAGATALVREWLVTKRGVANPSGALMKASLINGAADMSPGQYTSPQEVPDLRPNNVTGWGRVDLIGSLNPPLPRQIWLQDNTSGLTTGNSTTYTLTLGAPPALALNSDDTVMQEPASASVPQTASETPEPPSGSLSVIKQSPGEVNLASVDNAALLSPAGPDAIEQLIQNGGFESDGNWTTASTARTTTQAFSGSWSMGSTAAADGSFYQSVSLPSDVISATLDYYWKNDPPDTSSTGCYDVQYTEIWDESFSTQIGWGPVYCATDTGWHHLILDLDDIIDDVRGQTVNVVFLVDQDDYTPDAVFYFDDVSLNASIPGAVPTATPTATPTSPPPPPPGDSSSLRVTLAWTDYPGEPAVMPALVNNLDLEVIAPDGTTHYYGNAGLYTSGTCLRDGRWDACNNVEGVIIPDAPNGDYRVIVHGHNVPQGPQPFALVASGDNLLGTAGNLKSIFLPLVVH